jgi:membrane dipeptidase
MSTGAESAAHGRAQALLRDSLVWDNHGCMPLRPYDTTFLPQLQRYRDADADVVMLNVGFGEQGVEEHVRMLAALRQWLLARPQDYVLLDTVDDIEHARATGRLAVGFDIEGANAIADQISLVQLYRDLGVRWMLLAYNRNNRVGGGCQDNDTGLTPFGREVIAEMERVGMTVCLSHTGYRTAMDAMAVATKPVIFSHSCARAVHDHPRNITDEMMRACAATGGVVGINGIGIFLGNNDASTEVYVGHVDHAVQTIGPEHVALGLDYVFDRQELDEYVVKMRQMFPAGFGYEAGIRMVAPEQLASIVEALLTRGYSEKNLRAILGGNWMRVARQSWRPHDRVVVSPTALRAQ